MTHWTTQDGRKLEIKWMQSQHLVHTFNMLMREHGLSSHTVEGAGIAGSNLHQLYRELKTRGLLEGNDGRTQLAVPDIRETRVQLCLLRALIDTGESWPGVLDYHGAKSCIWHQFDSALQDLQRHAQAGDERAKVILARFTEYRLSR